MIFTPPPYVKKKKNLLPKEKFWTMKISYIFIISKTEANYWIYFFEFYFIVHLNFQENSVLFVKIKKNGYSFFWFKRISSSECSLRKNAKIEQYVDSEKKRALKMTKRRKSWKSRNVTALEWTSRQAKGFTRRKATTRMTCALLSTKR